MSIHLYPSGPSAPLRETVFAFQLLLAPFAASQSANPARELVNPFIGTGGHGHTFPGACVPNGLVQLSPDTRPDGYMDWDGCGGYHYSDSLIYGFSHTHLSGTGVADLCDVLLMPMSIEPSTDPERYRSAFDHGTEQAGAGYYKVHLQDERIDVELTATPRCGVHRYTYPRGSVRSLVVDLAHRDALTGAHLELTSAYEVTGFRRSSSWAKDQQLYFVIRFNSPSLDAPDLQRANGIEQVEEHSTRRIFRFAPDEAPLVVTVGISAVSVEGARKNMLAEVPVADFDLVRKQAEDRWNAKLNKVKVEGGTPEQQRIFYTAMYHSYVAPYIFNDVDGHYRGMDGMVHKADHDVYTVFSLWDTFRGLHPLMTILEPEMTSDWIKTFLLHYMQTGRLPVWELWGNETDCMIGYHSASVIADAHLKGIRGFDEQLALEALREGARMDHFGLKAYRERGFISSEDGAESVSRTLEYAYDDACITRFASHLEQVGGDEHRNSFPLRAQNWRHLFDPGTGFFRARRNGGFSPGFDPYEVNFNYTEANAWQYSLFVPQDIPALIAAHGGVEPFESHLDKLFSTSSSTSGREQADITGLIGQYAHGNEPSHHMAYLYNTVGKPEKTRVLVKRIMDELYHDAPDGLSGNEDCGQMSAWYVLSALGFYPVSPGINASYELGYPLFNKAEIALPNGKHWTMAVADRSTWTASVPADTTRLISVVPGSIGHAELMGGGELYVDQARVPYRRFRTVGGTTLDGNYTSQVAPVIRSEAQTFSGTLELTVVGQGACIVKTGGRTRPCPMNTPFVIDTTATVEVDWSEVYAPIVGEYTKIDGSRTIQLTSTYANQYAAGGDRALIDGLRGGTEFRTGEWQGFEGQDLVATIDLGQVKELSRAGLSILRDQKSWIFPPKEVTVAWSTNKRQWSSRTITLDLDLKAEGGFTHEFWTEVLGKKARYISIVAKNAGPCPAWHPGRGGKTWLFADEVLIETR